MYEPAHNLCPKNTFFALNKKNSQKVVDMQMRIDIISNNWSRDQPITEFPSGWLFRLSPHQAKHGF